MICIAKLCSGAGKEVASLTTLAAPAERSRTLRFFVRRRGKPEYARSAARHAGACGTRYAVRIGMRRIRGSFHLALTTAGTALVLWAVLTIEPLYERILFVALGLVLMEAGIWRITQSLFPNERNYRPLRKETDFFIALVRRLNRTAISAQRGSASAGDDLVQIHDEMHHSVDRMLRLAGLTEEDLGFRYRPSKTPLPAATDVAHDDRGEPAITAR
jgi:hypothetical protein